MSLDKIPTPPSKSKPYVFRVIRVYVGDEVVRVLLEPYGDVQKVTLSEGDEFITGTLNSDPWLPEPDGTV